MPATSDPVPVVSEVRRLLHGRLERFGLDHCDEGLILVGRAPTFYVKQLAQHAVKRLTRVPIVRNEIEVAWAIEA
jgi:hypothetical protein